MRKIPITFVADMVLAQREGRKTQTRRLTGLNAINENPDAWTFQGWSYRKGKRVATWQHKESGQEVNVASPYGERGDHLWVKETCWVDNNYQPYLNRGTTVVLYAADEFNSYEQSLVDSDHMTQINARFMYKELARTWLEVVDVRVERLLKITEADALAEGILWYEEPGTRRYKDYNPLAAKGYGHPEHDYPTVGLANQSFVSLFRRINIKAPMNPWLWVVTFKPLDHAQQPKPAV